MNIVSSHDALHRDGSLLQQLFAHLKPDELVFWAEILALRELHFASQSASMRHESIKWWGWVTNGANMDN